MFDYQRVSTKLLLNWGYCWGNWGATPTCIREWALCSCDAATFHILYFMPIDAILSLEQTPRLSQDSSNIWESQFPILSHSSDEVFMLFHGICTIPWLSHDYPMIIPWLSHDYPHVFDSPLNQKWTRWKLFGHIHIIYIIFIFRNHFYFDPHTSILWKYKMYWIFYWYHVGHPNLRPIWPGSHLRLFSNLMPISLYPTVEFCNAFQRPGDGETRI